MATVTRLLPRRFYQRDVRRVACGLLGKRLVTHFDGVRTSGIIIETEAYLHEDDPACHASRGQTRSNCSMFGPAGIAYVYPIHSRWCFNAVAQRDGEGAAVLVRAIEPQEGIELMHARRLATDLKLLASGPGRLCQALGIDRRCDGLDLTQADQLWIEHTELKISAKQIRITPRIGVTSAHALLLRYVVAGHPLASGPKKLR